MTKKISLLCVALIIAATALALAQGAAMSRNDADYHSAAWLHEQGDKLVEKARNSGGIASLGLEKYPGHFTTLTARTKSGVGEMHAQWSDVFVALDGEATVLVGGTLDNRIEKPNGESGGTRVLGGTEHLLHKGDVIHISPGVAHQMILPEGKSFVYFVIKAEAEPKAHMMPAMK